MKIEEMTNQPTDPEAKTKMEKLRLEVAELQWKVRWAYKVGQFVSVITAFLAIGAVVVSIFQINAAYQQDFKKPVWEKQLKVLGEISETASAIAVLPAGTDERTKAEMKFEQLFWGPVAITENELKDELKDLMVKFMKCYDGSDEDCKCRPRREQKSDAYESADCEASLQSLSMQLSEKCRMKVGSIWSIDALISRTPTPPPADVSAITTTPTPTPESTELP